MGQDSLYKQWQKYTIKDTVWKNTLLKNIPDDIQQLSANDETENNQQYDTLSKKYKRNALMAGGGMMMIQVPYKGFFKHNELYNLQGKNIQFAYMRSFGKKNRWEWGMMFGYEWYQLDYYDIFNSNGQGQDSNWYDNKYKYGKEMDNYINYGTYNTVGLSDSMFKYYGRRTYNLEYVRIGWLLGYTFQLSKRFSVKLKLSSSGIVARNISRLNKYLSSNNATIIPSKRVGFLGGYIDPEPSVTNTDGDYTLPFSPFYIFVYPFEKINKTTRNGMVKYHISLSYDVKANQSILLDFSFANLIMIKYGDFTPYLIVRETPFISRGLGGIPQSYNHNAIFISLPILINTYRIFQFSLLYTFKF